MPVRKKPGKAEETQPEKLAFPAMAASSPQDIGVAKGYGSLSELAMAVLRQRAESLAQEGEDEGVGSNLSILLFLIGDEWYAVGVDEVREICNDYDVTPIPCAPRFIRGVINIRGEIISITDLRLLLGLPGETGIEARPPVIVVGDGETVTALLVDQIGDIVEVTKDGMQSPLTMADKTQADYVRASVSMDDRIVALVNLEKVLAPVGA